MSTPRFNPTIDDKLPPQVLRDRIDRLLKVKATHAEDRAELLTQIAGLDEEDQKIDTSIAEIEAAIVQLEGKR
jgi:hypothetical protein